MSLQACLNTSSKKDLTAVSGSTSNALTFRCERGIPDFNLAQYIYLERRANEGTQTYSKMSQYSELPAEYQPRSQQATFSLAVIHVPRQKVRVWVANPSPDLLNKFVRPQYVLFCVHPAILGKPLIHMDELTKMFLEKSLVVAPTASSRTMVAIDPQMSPYCVKVHCPYKISRFVRTLGPKVIAHSIKVSSELEKINHLRFAILAESIGCSLPAKDGENGWGFIIRELTPRPYVAERRKLIPCFSMYGKDSNHPDEPPLLVKMIKKSGENPKEYVLNKIMFPIIECFIIAFKERGILMEAHGQNTLLEVDGNDTITRVVHRDFDEEIDAQVRRKLGLDLDGFMSTQIVDKPSEHEPKGSVHSVIYDKSIGLLHLDYLAKTMQEYYGILPQDLQKECQKYFAKLLPDHAKYFPPEIFFYSDKAIAQNVYPLIGTGKTPVWRPPVPLRARL